MVSHNLTALLVLNLKRLQLLKASTGRSLARTGFLVVRIERLCQVVAGLHCCRAQEIDSLNLHLTHDQGIVRQDPQSAIRVDQQWE